MKLGIFGGAFDPPHTGHLTIAGGVRDALELDRVLFVPYAAGPHRDTPPCAAGSDRLAMLRACLAGRSGFTVDDRELCRGGLSWMVETLREIGDDHPGAELYLIIGADQLEIFSTWRDWREILELACIVVVGRPGHEPTGGPPELRERMVTVELPPMHLSSSEVRRRVRRGLSIRHLVPEAVLGYIQEHDLYAGADETEGS
jgi:nicotinate-nucleotide adenylyltransferase